MTPESAPVQISDVSTINAVFDGPQEPSSASTPQETAITNPIEALQNGTYQEPTPAAAPAADSATKPDAPSLTLEDFLAQQNLTPQNKENAAPQPAAQPAAQPPTPAAPQEFADFPEHERNFFNQASKPARAYFAEKLREARKLDEQVTTLKKELAEAKDHAYYLDPDAVNLHPDYKRHQQTLSLIETKITPHWETQLARLRKGEEVFALVQDEKGNIFPDTQPLPPTAQTEAYIISTLAQLGQVRHNVGQQLSQLADSYKNETQGFYSTVKKLDADFLPTPPPALKAEIESQIAKFPPYIQHRPEYRMLAKFLVITKNLSQQINNLKAAQQTRVAQQNGPAAVASTPPSGSDGTMTREQMDAFMQSM